MTKSTGSKSKAPAKSPKPVAQAKTKSLAKAPAILPAPATGGPKAAKRTTVEAKTKGEAKAEKRPTKGEDVKAAPSAPKSVPAPKSKPAKATDGVAGPAVAAPPNAHITAATYAKLAPPVPASLRMVPPAPPAPPAPAIAKSVPPPFRSGPPKLVPSAVPPPPPENVVFKVGDLAVHPNHGVGEVVSIDVKDLGGSKVSFYVLRIIEGTKESRVWVSMTAAAQVGLRPIMSSKEADAVLDTMRAREVAVDLQPWSRRFRAYTEMIKSGSAYEIAKVLRDMHRLKFDKDLSFGERRLLDQAKSLLMKELAVAKRKTEADLAAEVASMFTA